MNAVQTTPLRLGIAGLGTVGQGLIANVQARADHYLHMLGRRIVVTAVSARSKDKARSVRLDDYRWFDDAVEMARSPDIDVLVELIGGADGIAKDAVEAALAAGKHVVTANKALLAHHGLELARAAEKKGVALAFEAAVAGGIPIVKTVREALAGNDIRRVYGILNGTCNYILTAMQEEGRAFDDVLAEAQAKGYAEADPTFDIGGFDAAHKLALLTSLAFGTQVAVNEIHVEGIQSITLADVAAADELGYRIKLLGVAVRTEHGIEQRVHPAMVPKDSAIGEVDGVTNCVAVEADYAGNLLLVGAGAGAKPTASAVASDICDIASGFWAPPFRIPAARLAKYKRATLGKHQGAYYVRLAALDQPGAMAAIARRMAEQDVSLESIVQRRAHGKGQTSEAIPVLMITHETTEAAIRRALDAIERDGKVAERPQMIRIEQL